MNTKRSFGRGVKVLALLFIMAAVLFGGDIKNKGTFTNSVGSTVNVATFFNYKTGTGGSLANGGAVNASAAVDNANGTSSINNTGTISISGVTGLLNNVVGAAVTNSGSGLIQLTNAGSIYNNAGGTTTNTAVAAGKGILITGTMDVSSGTFTTTAGRMEYQGTGLIYSGVATSTYGILDVNTAGTRTLNGNVSSGDVTITAGTMSVGNFKLTATGVGGIQGAGTLVANAGANSEVDYAGDNNQPVKATSYSRLTLSGATAPRTKTAPAAVTATGYMNVGANNTFALDLDLTYNGTAANFTNSGVITIKGDAVIGDGAVNGAVFTYNGAAGDGNGDQLVAGVKYSDLTVSGTASKTFPAATVQISGNYVVVGGAGARSYPVGSDVVFNGVTQTIAGEAYRKLEIWSTTSGTLAASASATNTAGNDAVFVNAGATFVVPLTMTLTVNTGDLSNEGTVTNNGTITVN